MVGRSAPLPRDEQPLQDLIFRKRWRAHYLRNRRPRLRRSKRHIMYAGVRQRKSWAVWFWSRVRAKS